MFKNFSNFSRKISFILFFVLIFAFIWRISFLNLDPDLGWHLKFGRDTWLTHQLPRDQMQLWTINGTWVDHEWLSNIIMYLIYSGTGYIGLTFVFALIPVFGLWLIAKHLRRDSLPLADIFIALLMALGAVGILPHLGPRPQEISFLFLIIEIIWLQKSDIKNNWQTIVKWFIFFWVWTCLHAGFIIGLAVLGLWALEKLIVAGKRRQTALIKSTIFISVAAVAATLLTPYGWRLYDFLETYNNNAYLTHISEWKSAWIFPVHYWQLLFLALSIAFSIILIVFNSHKKIKPWQWLTVLMFAVMSLKSVRHFPLFFACASLILLPEFIVCNFNETKTSLKKNKIKLIIHIILPLVLIGISWLALVSIDFVNDPFQKICADYPCYTARMLQLSPRYQNLKLLNLYDYGGWLIWVWPEKKLFIDGRLPQYPFAGHSLLEEYLAFGDKKQTADKLKTYDIESVLWRKQLPQYNLNWLDKLLGFSDKQINGRTDDFKQYLDNSGDWLKVFTDEASIVYIRKDKY